MTVDDHGEEVSEKDWGDKDTETATLLIGIILMVVGAWTAWGLSVALFMLGAGIVIGMLAKKMMR